ncbi:serine hydrolase domain-containing protein, partial [Proteiniclasticum ruminis]|uniref:serine hydrolase domain-containing protein n=1 Tax=Proteiniclasticum ruminis TaxID=398199 RepID=UPI00289CD911
MDIEKNIGKDFSGVISVVEKDKIIYQKAFGYRDRANEIPNTVDTRFETASAGKAFVAAAILKHIEEGSLNFETALGDVLDFDLQ